MTSLYAWYDSSSPTNDFKCVRIFQHENNKNSVIRVRDTGQQIGSSLVFIVLLDRSDRPGIAEPEK